LDAGFTVGDGHGVDAVLNLATVPVVLPFDAAGVAAALGCTGFIEDADRLVMSVFGSDNLLASVSQ
jgi:hypothetical protein